LESEVLTAVTALQMCDDDQSGRNTPTFGEVLPRTGSDLGLEALTEVGMKIPLSGI
jgi:hypothetical protein